MDLKEINRKELTQCIHAGDVVVDATAGNGYDTLFLRQAVGLEGRVYAIDLQSTALLSAGKRIHDAGVDASNILWIHGSHENLKQWIAPEDQGKLAAVVFNLGYLPGSDKSCITHADSTLKALEQALGMLSPGGLLSVMVYSGHPGGEEEAEEVRRWFCSLPDAYAVQSFIPKNKISPPGLCLARFLG